MRRRAATLLLPLAIGLAEGATFAPSAWAQETPVDRARSLAQDAAEQLDEQKYAEALDSATKAEELYHAATHLLIMGRSLEGLGRLAEAADTYERLAAEQLPPTAAPVFKKAQETGNERLKELLARVPSLVVKVRFAGAPVGSEPDATVTVDGKPFAVRAVATRLDPGRRAVKVEAPGHVPVERQIDLPEKGGVVVVEVDLRREGAPAAPPPPPQKETQQPERDEGSLVPAVVALSIGGVGLGVGAVTGAIFLSQMGDLHDQCPADRCAPGAQADIDAAGTMGNLSTIGFGVGIAGAVAGVVLLAIRPGGSSAAVASASVSPFASADLFFDGDRAGVRGRF